MAALAGRISAAFEPVDARGGRASAREIWGWLGVGPRGRLGRGGTNRARGRAARPRSAGAGARSAGGRAATWSSWLEEEGCFGEGGWARRRREMGLRRGMGRREGRRRAGLKRGGGVRPALRVGRKGRCKETCERLEKGWRAWVAGLVQEKAECSDEGVCDRPGCVAVGREEGRKGGRDVPEIGCCNSQQPRLEPRRPTPRGQADPVPFPRPSPPGRPSLANPARSCARDGWQGRRCSTERSEARAGLCAVAGRPSWSTAHPELPPS